MNEEESPGERRRFAVFVAAGFLLLTLPRLFFHELWRDEAWLWLVVTESRSLGDLFAPLSRSGQGYLFPVLCYLASLVSTSPRAMQLVHLLLAVAAAFAFARWAPLARRERALFVLGYFPFFEYAVVSRHYVLGGLLAWLAAAAARSRRPALALGAALGLLCQTTVYGFILGLAVAFGWLLDRRLHRGERPSIPGREAVAGLALGLAGAAVGLVQLIPRSGTSFATGWHFFRDSGKAAVVLRLPWRSFFPLPRFELHFWGSNVLAPWPLVQTVGGALTLALAAALLWRRKVALLTFALGAAGLLAFAYVKHIGSLRHHGHFWLLFALALWLGGGFSGDDRRSWRGRVLLLLLLIHLSAGAYASWMDLRHPFSNGPATAEFLRREGLDRHPLLGYHEPPTAAVALPLGRPLYFPSRGVFTTYPDWGPLQRDLSRGELRCAARALAAREGKDIVLVINDRKLPPWEELTPAGAVHGAIVDSEDYHLYRLHHDRLAATARAVACH